VQTRCGVGRDRMAWPSEVLECECLDPTQCHLEIFDSMPLCVGDCPDGFDCVVTETPIAGTNLTEVRCECVEIPPECEPLDDGTGCHSVVCPDDPTLECKPVCIIEDSAGNYICERVENPEGGGIEVSCHCVPDNTPLCEPDPTGMICEREDTDVDGCIEVTCRCVDDPPPMCEALPDGSGCQSTQCPDGISICKPTCVRVNADGTMEVTECGCLLPTNCSVAFGPPDDVFCDRDVARPFIVLNYLTGTHFRF
jgi:hypothetical protein